jgi:hypothetical protein
VASHLALLAATALLAAAGCASDPMPDAEQMPAAAVRAIIQN